MIEILERLTQMAKAMEGSGGDIIRAGWRRFGAAGFVAPYAGAISGASPRSGEGHRFGWRVAGGTSGRVKRLVAGDRPVEDAHACVAVR